MRNAKFMPCALLLVFGLATTDLVYGDNCSGYDVLVFQSAETTEIAKGHTMTVVKAYSIDVEDNTSSPFHLTTGECSGTIVSTPDGVTRASGHCVRRDKAGDTYSLEWTLPAGAQKYSWRHVGGTRKLSSDPTYGWAQYAASDGKITVNRLGATCQGVRQ